MHILWSTLHSSQLLGGPNSQTIRLQVLEQVQVNLTTEEREQRNESQRYSERPNEGFQQERWEVCSPGLPTLCHWHGTRGRCTMACINPQYKTTQSPNTQRRQEGIQQRGRKRRRGAERMPRASQGSADKQFDSRGAQTSAHTLYYQRVRSDTLRCQQTQALEEQCCEDQRAVAADGIPMGRFRQAFEIKLGIPKIQLHPNERRRTAAPEGNTRKDDTVTEGDVRENNSGGGTRRGRHPKQRGLPGRAAHSPLGHRYPRRGGRNGSGFRTKERQQSHASLWSATTSQEAKDHLTGPREAEGTRNPRVSKEEEEWNPIPAPSLSRQQERFGKHSKATMSRDDSNQRWPHADTDVSLSPWDSIFQDLRMPQRRCKVRSNHDRREPIPLNNSLQYSENPHSTYEAANEKSLPQSNGDNEGKRYTQKAHLQPIVDCFGETITSADLQRSAVFGNRSQFCGILPTLRLQKQSYDNILHTCIAAILATVGVISCMWMSFKGSYAMLQGIKTSSKIGGGRDSRMITINERRHNTRGRWKTHESPYTAIIFTYLVASTCVECPMAQILGTPDGSNNFNGQEVNTQTPNNNYTDNQLVQARGTVWKEIRHYEKAHRNNNFEMEDDTKTQDPPICRGQDHDTVTKGSSVEERLSDEPDLEHLRRMIREDMENERQQQRHIAQINTRMERNEEIWMEIRALSLHEPGRRFGVKMYGLKHIHQDTRVREASMDEVRDRIGFLVWLRAQWTDLIRFEDTIHTHYIIPQPSPYISGADQLHLLMDLSPELGGTPILFAIRHVYQPLDAGIYVFVSHRASPWMSHEEATRASSTNIMCNAPHNSCRSWVNQEYLTGHREIPTRDGMLWTIDVYFYDVDLEVNDETQGPQEEDVYSFIQGRQRFDEGRNDKGKDQINGTKDGKSWEYDATTLTQVRLRSVSRTPPRAATRTRYRVALIHKWGTEDPREIPLQGTPTNMVHQCILDHLHTTGQIGSPTRTRIYEARPNPPGNTRQNELVVLREEMQDQRQGRVLTILDIDVIPSAADRIHSSMTKREVLYVESRSNRETWLQEVGMRHYCTGPDDQCLVLARGQLWDLQDTSTKTHENGDYFMISLPHPEGESHFDEIWQLNHPGSTTHATPHCNRPEIHLRERNTPTNTSSDETTLLQTERRKQEPEEDELTYLMMQSRHSRRTRFRDAQVFREGDGGPIFVQLTEVEENAIMQHIERVLCRPTQGEHYKTSNFYEVHPKPEDMAHTGSMVLIQEPKTHVKEGQVIILLDYVILQDTTGPMVTVGRDGWRETRYIHKNTNRREWLTEIGMSNFCPVAYDRCLVTMAGRPWKAQDNSAWAHTNGAYAQIIAPQPSQRIPFRHFWQCTQNGMSVGNAWLQAQIQFEEQQRRNLQPEHQGRQQKSSQDEQQEGRIGNSNSSSYLGIDEVADDPATEEEAEEQTSLLQEKAHIRTTTREVSFAKHAQTRLPPPGNGREYGRSVTFSDKVQSKTPQGDRQIEQDLGISNEFVWNTQQRLRGHEGNEFVEQYTKGLRRGTGLPTKRNPASQGYRAGKTKQRSKHDEEGWRYRQVGDNSDSNSLYPHKKEVKETRQITLEGNIGEGYLPIASTPPNGSWGVCFKQVLELRKWFDAFMPIPEYGRENVRWKRTCSQIHELPIWQFQEGHLHFYMDGSKGSRGIGIGVLLLVQGHQGWYFAGFLRHHK